MSDLSVETYLKSHALQFYLSDLVRHLAAVVPVDPSVAGGGPSADRVVTPQSSGAPASASSMPATPSAIGPSASGPSNSGVYSPTTPPAGPTAIPTATQGAPGPSSAGGGNNASMGLGMGQLSLYNFDDILSEIPQFLQDALCGRHVAGLGAPWEYLLCTNRNRLTLCLLVHRALTLVMPALLAANAAVTGHSSTFHVDTAAGLLGQVAGLTPLPWQRAIAVPDLDVQALFLSLVQLHCSDMPSTWLYAILRRAAALYSRMQSRDATPSLATAIPPLAPHAIVHRMFLLHVCCKELVEDLQAAFPVGGGGAPAERCRSDMCTWRRTFDRWGLDGSWRCGAPRSATSVAAAAIVSVEPYIPVLIINAMFDAPGGVRDAVGVSTTSTISLDADAVCSLIVHSDEWFLWCCRGHDALVASCFI
jgi:hypothetical protein